VPEEHFIFSSNLMFVKGYRFARDGRQKRKKRELKAGLLKQKEKNQSRLLKAGFFWKRKKKDAWVPALVVPPPNRPHPPP
jgi:collagenase-like PrtC family protease